MKSSRARLARDSEQYILTILFIKMHLFIADCRKAFANEVEVQRCVDMNETLINSGLVAVTLCCTETLSDIIETTGIAKKMFIFPVMLYKGYHMTSDKPTGGTGLFVVLQWHTMHTKLIKLRNIGYETLLPNVGFSYEHQCFFANKNPLIQRTVKSESIPDEDNLLTEFMASLGQFVELSGKSCAIIMGTMRNNAIAFAGQAFLQNKRRCLFLDTTTDVDKILPTSMGRVVPLVSLFSANYLKERVLRLVEHDYKSSFKLLPPTSPTRGKLANFTWLQNYVTAAITESTINSWVDEEIEKIRSNELYTLLFEWEHELVRKYNIDKLADAKEPKSPVSHPRRDSLGMELYEITPLTYNYYRQCLNGTKR